MSTNARRVGIEEVESEFGVLTFGRLLKSHRLGEGFSQVEMAKCMRLSKQSLNDLENERKIPSIRRAVEIGKKLGVLEELVVQLVLQDHLRREKLNYKVKISKIQKAS